MLGRYLDKYLMRVLFCKIPRPSFICFCKPSSHIYSSGPLKLENTSPKCNNNNNNNNNNNSVPENSDQILGEENNDKEEIIDEKQTELAQKCLKSSLKKPISDSGSPNEKQKKKVQWKDFLGTELVEIREFETRTLGLIL
ncbi:uncharacterized protein LOC133781445 isoform X2 [Humulus lupulus]|uniref:uncharacterized protein LOC133781445 isoform X2 n=1 Tax=Humulus lupulus TaxID=3486 RepID=UPI002B413C2D|nr:uncharacterized protein LOC133781445 isoform X2 [Humulus lupulus]